MATAGCSIRNRSNRFADCGLKDGLFHKAHLIHGVFPSGGKCIQMTTITPPVVFHGKEWPLAEALVHISLTVILMSYQHPSLKQWWPECKSLFSHGSSNG
ncbi:hypothetical protein TNCT_290061 [Trichonephila clavata]|uniref:Uncharacterized protein n=1 Tax=Trichonephila clavata TaxID=2740835 RepID=A0A8X6GQS1_TRICU|nr:hypothetical protein TNCT_290061 [Trichonephila clavata]